jgi:23S rRNA (uracil1939-C5)-methyltransferase
VTLDNGIEPLRYAIPGQGLDFGFLPRDFTQVNPAINDQLVARCMEWLAPEPADTVADFFCGLGNFSLALAQRAGRVIGVEVAADMVTRAGANAARAGLTNLRFEQGDLFDEALTLPQPINKAVLDPPRAGAKELARQLATSKNLKSLVYVSCNPQTLARDLAILVEGGFGVRRAGLVDMFPQTGHMEAIVLLAR